MARLDITKFEEFQTKKESLVFPRQYQPYHFMTENDGEDNPVMALLAIIAIFTPGEEGKNSLSYFQLV